MSVNAPKFLSLRKSSLPPLHEHPVWAFSGHCLSKDKGPGSLTPNTLERTLEVALCQTDCSGVPATRVRDSLNFFSLPV